MSNEYENIFFRSLISRKDGTEPLALVGSRVSQRAQMTLQQAHCEILATTTYGKQKVTLIKRVMTQEFIKKTRKLVKSITEFCHWPNLL